MSTIEKAIKNLNSDQDSKDDTISNFPDETVVDKTDVTRRQVPTDGEIRLPWEAMRQTGMLTPEDGRSQIAEELRAIKRPLLRFAFSQEGNQRAHNNLIMVTSSVPGEGKSFSSINLAVSIATELDRTALLVDADVARPSIAKYLGFRAKRGLVDYLLDKNVSISDVLLKTDLPKLSILPAGRTHHYSTELLASENMRVLLDELSTRYQDRVVIFDSPPVLATSEAQVLANQMGQVVVVVEAVKTSQAMLNEALTKLSDANIAGLLLNKSRVKSGGSYYGEYGYYGSDR